MPTLVRSCTTCIKAKRRCDLQSPRCERCRLKELDCAYTNEPSTQASIGAVTFLDSANSNSWSIKPEALSSDIVALRHKIRRRRNSQSLRNGEHATSWPPSVEDGVKESTTRLAKLLESLAATRSMSHDVSSAHVFFEEPWSHCVNLPVFPKMMTIDPPSTRYIITTLKSYPASLAANTASPVSITHPLLLRRVPPQTTVAEVFLLCSEASFPTIAASRRAEIIATLRDRVEELVWQVIPEKLSTEPLLLATQALILAAITLYLNPEDLAKLDESHHVWPEAQKRHFNALYHCNRRLWDMAPWNLPDHVDETTKWLMGESIRRTLIISLVLPDVLLNMSDGCFVYTGFVAIMPFDERMAIWDKIDGIGGASSLSVAEERRVLARPRLLSYRELVVQYLTGTVSKELVDAPFVKFLLICCLGCGAVTMPETLEPLLRQEGCIESSG